MALCFISLHHRDCVGDVIELSKVLKGDEFDDCYNWLPTMVGAHDANGSATN